jgi:hypothetical protein
MFKDTENKILDKTEAFLKKSKLNDKTIYHFLYGFHIFIVFFFIFFFIFGSKPWFIVITLVNIFIYSCFFIFNGCILSKLERRFSSANNIDPIDTLLWLIKKEITNKNRIKYTKITFIFLPLCFFALYYFRFSRSKSSVIN